MHAMAVHFSSGEPPLRWCSLEELNMTASQIYDMEKIIWELKNQGWQEQRDVAFFNGKLAVRLIKGGEAMTIEYDFYPGDGSSPENQPDESCEKAIDTPEGRPRKSHPRQSAGRRAR